jgi:3-oxoadipate enol-lactonase
METSTGEIILVYADGNPHHDRENIMPKIQIRDIRIYYESIGEGQPLVFIHGLGSSTKDWEKQVAFFSSRYRVVTFDCRGHGQSDKPRGRYSIRTFAEDTAALIKALGIAPAHIVGLSMGGMIAFQLAVDEPDMVKTMVIVNSGPALILHTLREKWMFFKRRLIVRFLGMRMLGKFLGNVLLPDPEQAQIKKIFVERWSENDRLAYLASMKALFGWSVIDKLGNIQCPSLIITADQDYTPAAAKEAYASLMPRAKVIVINKSRHLTPIDQAQAFNDAVMDFLSQHSASGTEI